MIGRLKGLVDGVGDGWVLIDVNGVCYLVEGSGRMLSSPVSYTHLTLPTNREV